MSKPHHRTDLNQGKLEALQAIFNSVSPRSPHAQTSPELLKKLSDKLDEIVGGDELGQHKNEAGELVNEEGLPIIEISEPLGSTEDEITSNFIEEPLPLLRDLSPAEKEVRRRERERVLDLLEQEEESENRRIAEAAEEERKEEMRKRREAAREETQQRNAARELQKKMGKALVGGGGKAKNQTAKESPQSSKVVASPLPPGPVRRVTFVEPEASSSKITEPTMTLAKSPNPSTLPMSMNVVERFPAKPPSPVAPATDPSKPQPQLSTRSSSLGSPTSSSDELLSFDSEGEAEMDYAAHQHEVAKEYFKKRGRLTRDMLEDESEGEYVPENASLTDPKAKPSMSRFKAEKQSSTGYFMPAHGANSIRRSVRLGKLKDDQLVGGEEGDSGSDGDEDMKQIIELLAKGEVVNAGPEGVLQHAEADRDKSMPKRKGPSKFKVNRSEVGRLPSSSSELSSTMSTPVITAARSSPKNPSTPTIGGITEYQLREEVHRLGDVLPLGSTQAMPPMIVDSPSFAPPSVQTPAIRSNRPPTVMSSMVMESSGVNTNSLASKKDNSTSGKKISRFMAERM